MSEQEVSMTRRIKRPSKKWWSAHTHSHFSHNDAISSVDDLVATAASHGQRAIGLTDHGNMCGAVRLYKSCKDHGIKPLPGIEAYIKRDATDKDEPRYHLGLLALDRAGYEALVAMTSRSHQRERFHRKPQMDFTDFAEWAERGWTDHVALLTGCYFGMVVQSLVSDGIEGLNHAWDVTKSLASWFPHTYVEVQHHHIDHGGWASDDVLVRELTRMANLMGLPIVATQDAHYARPDEKPYHESLKRLVSFDEDPDDAVFPGDSFHLAEGAWVAEHYEPDVWAQAQDGLDALRHSADVVIPELETYHYRIPKVTVDHPHAELERLCAEFANETPKSYQDRLIEELDVVGDTGMAGYLMLVKEVVDWCLDHGVFFQARGSASGSLLCYLLRITQVDPIKWNLRYERFLSRDRTKPPDVDLDVEDTRRDELLGWLRRHFSVCQIGTHATYSIHTTGANSGGGSLFVAALSKKRKEGVDVSQITSVYDLDTHERSQLFALASRGVKKSVGTHAAGLVVTASDDELYRMVPTMLVPSSNTTVTQFEMDDVEEFGLVKLDVLGLRTLSLLRRVVELSGRSVHDGLDWIPLNDKDTFRMLRKGSTDGIFQLEGYTNSRGCQEMRVSKVDDLIDLVALYRPATMQTGIKDDYIARRDKHQDVPDRHSVLNQNLNDTYGLPVFQEQVIGVLRDVGFTPDELTEFLKAVKASNKNVAGAGETVASYQPHFRALAAKCGFSQADIDFAWQMFTGFASYSFNRAHATSYGLTAYYMAYLKAHYPMEFATALLETSAGTQKEKNYVLAVKRDMSIKMLGPDVNVSGASWTLDRKAQAIRKGLVSIKGVGGKAANEIATHAPYDSMEDLLARVDPGVVTGGKSWHKNKMLNGVLGKLAEAGALRSVGVM